RRTTAAMSAQLRSYVTLRVLHLPDGVQPDQLTTDAAREILRESLRAGTIFELENGCGMRPAAQVREREKAERENPPIFCAVRFSTRRKRSACSASISSDSAGRFSPGRAHRQRRVPRTRAESCLGSRAARRIMHVSRSEVILRAGKHPFPRPSWPAGRIRARF